MQAIQSCRYPLRAIHLQFRIRHVHGLYIGTGNYVLSKYPPSKLIFINTTQTSTFSTSPVSYLLSVIYVGLQLIIMFGIAIVVQISYSGGKRPKIELYKTYPKFQSAFELQRFESKAAQLYYVQYIARRLLMAALLVFVSNGTLQTAILIMFSLLSLWYHIQIRPFEEPFLNKLEIFNEFIILICCYHMLLFSEANSDFTIKYSAGWSLDVLIIVQFLFNVLSMTFQQISRSRLVFRRLMYKQRLKQQVQSSKT